MSLTGTPDRRPFATKSPSLVVLYASWCGPCAEELPEVLALARRLADNSKIKMIFVSSDEASGPQALLASFEDLLAKAGHSTSDLPAGLGLRADPQGGWFAALAKSRVVTTDPKSLPQLWLLDHKGRLRAHLGGPLTAEHASTLATLATSLSKEAR
jgi:thiol-disulfide isomerase/thioredoxin